MASLADLLLNWTGHTDPRTTLLQGIAGQPGAGGGTPGAVGTQPGTAAPPAPAQPPEAPVYQSPQQLMELYTQLQDRQRRASSVNMGIGLMGASLARPENRAGILAAFNSDTNFNDPSKLISGLIDFQSQSAQLSQKAAQRASVPSIAAKYGLDPTAALYLFDTGKLDSVIAELEKPNKQVVQGADGRSYIVDKNEGSISDPLGPEKPQELEIIDGPDGSKIVVDKNTKEPIKGRDPVVPEEGNTDFERNFRNALRERPDLTREQFRRDMNTSTMKRFTDAAGVDVGDPPTDMAWSLDENGMVMRDERGAPIATPIAGTKTDLANKEAAKKAEEAAAGKIEKQGMKERTANLVTENIDMAMDLIEKNKDNWIPATGLGAAVAGSIPQTPQYDVAGLLKTIQANIGFDKLQAMRDASPTGAALGPVSDFENQLLQATFGNLDLKQSHNMVMHNLRRIKRIYEGVINGEFVQKDAQGNVVPNQEAVNKAYVDSQKDVPLEELLKIYGE